MSKKLKRSLIAVTGVAALAGGGAAIATAATGGEGSGDKPITGKARDRAVAAALQRTGGGRVTATEVGDEESYYEVEVTRGDGSQVDVQLDRGFHVVKAKADDEGRHRAAKGR